MNGKGKVSCPICIEDFSIRQKKIPRFLKECGHTLCSACISQMLVKYPKITCPACRVETSGEYLSDYPKNFALLELLNDSGLLYIQYKPSVEDQQEDDEFLKQEEMKKQVDGSRKQNELEIERTRAFERNRRVEYRASLQEALERNKREAEEEARRRAREEEEMARAIYESEQAPMKTQNKKEEERRLKQEQEMEEATRQEETQRRALVLRAQIEEKKKSLKKI